MSELKCDYDFLEHMAKVLSKIEGFFKELQKTTTVEQFAMMRATMGMPFASNKYSDHRTNYQLSLVLFEMLGEYFKKFFLKSLEDGNNLYLYGYDPYKYHDEDFYLKTKQILENLTYHLRSYDPIKASQSSRQYKPTKTNISSKQSEVKEEVRLSDEVKEMFSGLQFLHANVQYFEKVLCEDIADFNHKPQFVEWAQETSRMLEDRLKALDTLDDSK